MSGSGSINLVFGDAEYNFCLSIKQLQELQDKCDAGPEYIRVRLSTSAWRVEDIRETIRLGLIGGGLPFDKALKLVGYYIDDPDRPLGEHVLTAHEILSAAIYGVPEDEPGKTEAGAATTEDSSRDENSDLDSSTPPAAP